MNKYQVSNTHLKSEKRRKHERKNSYVMKWLAVPEDFELGLKREKDKTKLTRNEPCDSTPRLRVRQIAQLKGGQKTGAGSHCAGK